MTINREGVAITTQNQNGFSYLLTSFGKAFVNTAAKAAKPVMDIGAAYGVATIPALFNGARVIAVDIDDNHLQSIARSVTSPLSNRLITMKKRFPDFDVEHESLSAVYLSQVFPFLTGSEIENGIDKIFDWLTPGGEVYIVCFTPYIEHVKSFIPVFEQRAKSGMRWAGYIEDLSAFSCDPDIYQHLPQQIHHVSLEDLRWVVERAGFVVKEARYFGEEEGPLPKGIRMDGRERVGIIAYKPVVKKATGDYATFWQPLSSVDQDQIAPRIRKWLSEPYVLSKALRKVCENFTVEVSDQGLRKLYADEIAALRCYDAKEGFVRETYLGDPGNPSVYARVTMPESTYQSKKEELDSLGNRPIGETLLYPDPTMTRSEFEIKRIALDDELLFDLRVHENFYKAEVEQKALNNQLWARRSMFHVKGKALLITEVFLSNIPDYRD